jgi:PRC-barrel domain
MLRTANGLDGFTIGATDGTIGQVADFYFDDQSWTVRYLVVDTGGWLAGRNVLISPISVRHIDWANQTIHVALTKSQVEASPGVESDQPVSRQHELEYYRYYGYPYYWEGPLRWGPTSWPSGVLAGTPVDAERGPATAAGETRRMPAQAEQEAPWWSREPHAEGDPHLHSTSEVTEYYIQATDGDIGHVEDFLIDEDAWAIRYIIVDTRNWWPGKKVLVSPEWISRVDWREAKVFVDMTREEIKNSPEYDPSTPVEREYETQLYEHYRRPRYWSDRSKAA